MVSEAPPFWWSRKGWEAWGLWPFAAVYGQITGQLMDRRRRQSVSVPVICVGNFTVGGAGKTPTAIALVREAKKMGLNPGVLSRGYGGTLDVTTIVDPHHHRATAVGDEPLLLAREAPTVISRRRVAGAQALVELGCDLIIMDDGFQSARLTVDYALIVIDSFRGIGNGAIVPAGPVRAPLPVQMRHLNAILKVGRGDAADQFVRQAARSGKPVLMAEVQPRDTVDLAGKKVFAFAGIADPQKFYRTLEGLGAEIVDRQAFPDHHLMDEDDIGDLLQRAEAAGLLIVTTAKDQVRLMGMPGRAEELLSKAQVVDVDMHFDDPDAPSRIIDQAIAACRARLLK